MLPTILLINLRTFFITIHFVLEIPFKQDWWLWVIYGLLALTQMLFSAVVKRTECPHDKRVSSKTNQNMQRCILK